MTEVANLDFDPLALEVTNELNNESRSKTGTWEHEDLAQVRYKVLRGHKDGINSCQFCVNDTRILTASDDKTCSLWNVETGDREEKYEGHPSCITQCHMSPDGSKFVSSCWDKRIRVWDVETGEALWTGLQGGIGTCCQFSHNGKLIASGTDLDNCLNIWDVENGQIIQSAKKHHGSSITSCKFSPDDSRVCTTSMDKITKLWDVASKNVTIKLGGHINIVSCCCFNKDERRLCTGSWDKQLQVWDVSTGTYRSEGPVTFSKGHEGSISACKFSSDGSMLISGSYDQTVVVWDAENCGPKLTLKGHTDWVTDVDITQDMKWILSGSRDHTIRLWNIENSDNIPVVLENKKSMGLKIVKCNDCGKPFSISQLDDPQELKMCVFCRLQANRPLLNLSIEEDLNMPEF
ncbi:WD repeat-containing protein 88-like [Patiria miniata]|uniref:WD repeat-containing protein 88 n=1 Tax=Patiria miniata TaxID=46514 RepID=A0A914B355_PATMI|nr:WD repeat-containing protein 88-like [Patiria miniata]